LEELDIDGRLFKNGPGDVDWMNPAQGKGEVARSGEDGDEHPGYIKFGDSLA
jgi:hypothetical protein